MCRRTNSPKALTRQGKTLKRQNGSPSLLQEILYLFIKIGVIILAGILLFTFWFGLHRVTDDSMLPAVKAGDLAVFYRLDKRYTAGDVLLVDYTGQRQVRRVIATAGDIVDVAEEGLQINGALQQEQEIFEGTYPYVEGVALPLTVKAGAVFLLADARENATDSRIYGTVLVDDTMGKVITIFRRRRI
jgi:signal peptidase I